MADEEPDYREVMAGREDQKKEDQRQFNRKAWIGLGVIAVVVGGCVALTSDDDDGGSASPSTDASTRLACEHFRNVAQDYSDGVLTLGELRSKFVEVEDDAQLSERALVRSSARRMLAGVTSGDTDELVDAISDMGSACTAAGT